MKRQTASHPSVTECFDLPERPQQTRIYRLLPKHPDPAYYRERTDRHIGWLTPEEQDMLKSRRVGIAGCGGMGALLAERLVRQGIGEVRIADVERFDVSNINRQAAATRTSVGMPKAFATARMIREVSDDTTLVVYPQGISEETAQHFVSGCDIICDEIEFWATGARVLLHREARKKDVTVFNSNTLGAGVRLFHFTRTSGTMEECLRLTYRQAKFLEKKIRTRTAQPKHKQAVMDAIITGLMPRLPNYTASPEWNDRDVFHDRLFKEGKGSILATNPVMATGFLGDHILFFLLDRFGSVKRNYQRPPEMPGYLYFDAMEMKAEVVTGAWW